MIARDCYQTSCDDLVVALFGDTGSKLYMSSAVENGARDVTVHCWKPNGSNCLERHVWQLSPLKHIPASKQKVRELQTLIRSPRGLNEFNKELNSNLDLCSLISLDPCSKSIKLSLALAPLATLQWYKCDARLNSRGNHSCTPKVDLKG